MTVRLRCPRAVCDGEGSLFSIVAVMMKKNKFWFEISSGSRSRLGWLLLLLMLSVVVSSQATGSSSLVEEQQEEVNDVVVFDEFPTADAAAAAAAGANVMSEKCLKDSQQQLDAFRRAIPWAVKMYESSGRLSNKLSQTESGNQHHETGLFDECLHSFISGNDDDDVVVTFQPQYCTVFFDAVMPIDKDNNSNNSDTIATTEGEPVEDMSNFVKSSASFCIPSTCSARDLRSAVAHRMRQQHHSAADARVVTITNANYCHTLDSISINKQFDAPTTIACLIFGLLVVLVASGTIYDLFWHVSSSANCHQSLLMISKVLYCFSAKRNGMALLSTKEDQGRDNNNQLPCLYGIRFLSMCLLMILHTGYHFSGYIYNTQTVAKNSARWEVQVMANASVTVDTFFLMSGLLVAMSLLRQLDRNRGKFNLFRFYLHRYIRITPLYAAILLFTATLLPRLVTGPDWHFVHQMSQASRRLWWSQLLYINNYVPRVDNSWNNPQAGMSESWYLACDMQMFWLSPLFIYPLWKWRKVGPLLVVLSLLTFLAVTTIPFIIYDLLPTLMINRPADILAKFNEYWHLFYVQTYARISPYILGILLGWMLHNIKKRGAIKMNKIVIASGWMISTLVAFVVVFGLAPYLKVEIASINSFVRISYGAFHRSAFALFVGWIIFTCCTLQQCGGYWVNRLLSFKVFAPLSRLCYAAYLINLNCIKVYTAQLRKAVYFSESQYVMTCIGFITLVFILSFFASLMVEMPFLNLDKILFAPAAAAPAPAIISKKEEEEEEEKEKDLNPSTDDVELALDGLTTLGTR